ncbi:MAG: DHH family phosphoesterase [Candidatus Woesearchaeota archaeon]
MIKNNSLKEIWDKLRKCKKVAMTLHYAPDGDSFGSCAAMKYVLERDFNCKVTLVSYDKLDDTLMTLPYASEVIFGTDITDLNLKDYDATLFMDSGTISGKLRDKYVPPKDVFIINIDHHETTKYNVSMNYIYPSAPSNCSILIELFKSNGVKFDKELSTRLLLGLCTDTLFLTVDGNTSLREAAFLVANGGDYQYILSKVLYNVPLKIKKYYAVLINKLKMVNINNKFVGYCLVDFKTVQDLKLNTSEIRLGVNYISDIKECDLIFTLTMTTDHVKGSFRSRKDIDVSKFAVLLGGSGHKGAAGFRVETLNLKDAEKIVLNVLKKNL